MKDSSFLSLYLLVLNKKSNSEFLRNRKVIDQMRRELILPVLPHRVISIVPSITELMVDLELGDRLVGSTLFCIHPSSLKKGTTRIVGTKTLNLEKQGV